MATTKGSQYSWYNLSIVLALCLGSLTYGYAFSIISTTLGQPGFYTYFSLAASPAAVDYVRTTRIIGATNGLFSAGAFMGCWTMGWMCDALGRKKSLWIATIISLIGGALQAGAAALPMFLVARWLTGYGVGNLVTLIPIMQAEIAPPASRGFLVGQHGVVLVAGYTIAGWVGYGCYFAENAAFQWRFPLALFCPWPTLLLLVIHWIPESPRWHYSILIYQGLGYTGSVPLLISGVYVTIGAIGNYINSLLADRLGRKTLFIIGLSGMLVALIFETALNAQFVGGTNKAGLSAALFFLFLHLAFYGCCIDANSFIYCSEIFPSHIRSKGMAWSVGTLFLTTIPYLEAAPTAFAQVGWKYYLLFILLTAINIPIIYFIFPETKGVALEEIAELFGDEVQIHLADINETKSHSA